jgi:hypothetical protein
MALLHTSDDDVLPPELSVMIGAARPRTREDLHVQPTAFEECAHEVLLVRND